MQTTTLNSVSYLARNCEIKNTEFLGKAVRKVTKFAVISKSFDSLANMLPNLEKTILYTINVRLCGKLRTPELEAQNVQSWCFEAHQILLGYTSPQGWMPPLELESYSYFIIPLAPCFTCFPPSVALGRH